VSRSELIVLAGLGAYHGVNPAMGWLFAVSRGLQEGRREAVLRSLGPIALGHELALVVVAGLLFALGSVLDQSTLRVAAAIALIGFGLWRFVRPRAHPRWTTMNVTGRELTLWSFLMSSAHGAGLMVAPVLLGSGAVAAEAGDHHPSMSVASVADVPGTAAGLALHVGTMLLVMGIIAVVVFDRLGVGILRRAWLNTDGLWAAAFVLAGAWTLVT
jgi:hypothetical protein